MQTIAKLAAALADQTVTARSLVDQYLDRIADPNGEGERVYLKLYADEARWQADSIDHARRHGFHVPKYAGIPISIKDLFDVAGEVTRAGSRVMDENPPAASDAPVVQRLRQAGFILLGKTNMTEFAYSGLGMNAHFGTPSNPYDRETGRIPGGSSSGGAVSVADDMAVATIGTDTGGSCRIPAAFCGIVGLKTTVERVPREGVVPLSSTLDSIGPLTNTVSCAAILDDVISGGSGADVTPFPTANLRLGVIQSYMLEQMDATVAAAYEATLARLAAAGAQLIELPLKELLEIPRINRNGGFVGAESYAWHRPWLETRGEYYDAWVKSRFDDGKAQSAADYVTLSMERTAYLARFAEATRAFDALICPTTPIIPPTFDELADAAFAHSINRLVLRNTAVANFLNRPAISLPCHEPGTAPVGMMLIGRTNEDRQLLSIAKRLETAITM